MESYEGVIRGGEVESYEGVIRGEVESYEGGIRGGRWKVMREV